MKMNKSQYWNKYYEQAKKTPRTLLVKSVRLVKNKNSGLDIGAGNLRDTRYMLEKKFRNIDVVDKQKQVNSFAIRLKDKRIKFYGLPVEKFKLEKKYDLINAQYSLPFMSKANFMKTFTRLKKSMNTSGIITGQFFGVHDSWKKNKNMTFVNNKQAKKLLDGLKIIYFNEEEKDGSTSLGQQKHWHVFHFIAKH